MPSLSYTSRRELEEHSFSPAVTLLVPVAAIVLQVLLSKLYWRFSMLDLPLIVAIFFAVSRRSPAVGTLTGAAIGLMQDALTGRPIGVNGMAKSVIGYIAASIGIQVDVDSLTTRVVMNFAFSILNSVHSVSDRPQAAGTGRSCICEWMCRSCCVRWRTPSSRSRSFFFSTTRKGRNDRAETSNLHL